MAALLGRSAGSLPRVPGVLLGAGPSLSCVLPALEAPIKARHALALAAPSVADALHRRRLPILTLARLAEAPWSVRGALTLEALGCNPIILAGFDLAFTDGLFCAAEHELHREWACELGPFRTIENLHTAAVLSAGVVEDTARTPDGTRSTRRLRAERSALDRLIESLRGSGREVIEIDPHAARHAATIKKIVTTRLVERQPIELPQIAAMQVSGDALSVESRFGTGASLADLQHEYAGAQVSRREPLSSTATSGPLTVEVRAMPRLAAVIACDPERGGTGVPRHLDSEFAGRTVLSATLERLGRVEGVERIILLVPTDFDPRPLFDPRRISLPVEVEACGRSPYPEEISVIRTARLWADSAWRGGVNGACVWDEVVAPAATCAALERRGLDAALICGPDWPVIMIDGLGGADEVVARYRSAMGELDMTYAPAPPGLGACVVGRPLLEALALRRGPRLLGERIDREPITREDPSAVLPVDRIRRSMVRAVLDSMRAKLRMRRGIEPIVVDGASGETIDHIGGWSVVEALEHQFFNLPPAFVPQHLIIELNTGRRASGSFSPHRVGSIQRPPMTERLLEAILDEVAAPRDVVITFGHVGDPLWHPELPKFIRMAHWAGARAVHVRTELLADQPRIEAMLAAGPDVISIDLHACTSPAYRALMGAHPLERVLANIESMLARLGSADPALRLPLIVPRLQRRGANVGDIERFVMTWRQRLGTAIVEGIPRFAESPEREVDPLIPAEVPLESIRREGARRMVVLSDGRVPLSELDLVAEQTIASIQRGGVFEVWRDVMSRRRQRGRDPTKIPNDLRCWQP
ncbi:MAG: radical SAM protein [Phycisphaeraceae bacterium]|nr:radical SAM protein [Phycisphaeraceae bacterium]